MKVSVVICTHTMDRYDDYIEAVESILDQTYENIEVVLVVDGNNDVLAGVKGALGSNEDIRIRSNDKNRGISYSRTRGAEIASGDIVAFIDDDALAAADWVEQLVGVYESTDAVAVGGKLAGKWVAEEPWFLPAEFYWLIGVTPRGFAEHLEEVRNTYGSNLSFKRDVFLEAGGFDENTGLKKDSKVQAHEAPVCLRVRENTGKGVVYNENAVVYHKIFDYRTDPWWLLSRAFWQGYSKRVMDLLLNSEDNKKGSYLKALATRFVPQRIRGLVGNPSGEKLVQLLMIFILTGTVGLGYCYGIVRPYDQLVGTEATE